MRGEMCSETAAKLRRAVVVVPVAVAIGLGISAAGLARELTMDTFMGISEGMSEAEVLSRTGSPDQRIEQLEPTPLGQRVVTYTLTFSSKTNKVLKVSRDRK